MIGQTRNRRLERLRNAPKITKVVRGRARIYSRGLLAPDHSQLAGSLARMGVFLHLSLKGLGYIRNVRIVAGVSVWVSGCLKGKQRLAVLKSYSSNVSSVPLPLSWSYYYLSVQPC